MSDTAQESILDLSDYVRILRKRWRWALSAFVAVVGAAILFPLLQTDSFTAQTRVLIGQSEAESVVTNQSQNSSFLTRSLANETSLIEGDSVRSRVEELLDVDTAPTVTVTAEGLSDVLRIRAISGTAQGAADAANAYAQSYVAEKQDRVANDIDAATAKFNADLERLGQERTEKRQTLLALQSEVSTLTSEARNAAIDERNAEVDERGASTDNEQELAQAEVDRLRRERITRDELLALKQEEVENEQSRISPQVNLLDVQINAVAKAVTDLELSGAFAAAGSNTVIETAVAPTAPSNTPLSRSIALGIVAGSIAAAAAALLAHNLDRTINSADDIRELVNLPVLGTVPQSDDVTRPALDLQTLERPESPVGDAYHRVRTALQFSFLSRDVRSVLVTSANPSEGKTTTSINLAGALAAIGSRVILADVDFRRPRLHQVFSIDMKPGLSDHLLDGTPLHELAFTVASANNSLVVLPSGSSPPSPGDLVSTPAFADLVRLVEKEGDIAVLDSPPILPVSDAITLSRLVDIVVITARAGSTTRDDLKRTVETLQQVGAEIAGIVLVGVNNSDQYYRYRSNYANSAEG